MSLATSQHAQAMMIWLAERIGLWHLGNGDWETIEVTQCGVELPRVTEDLPFTSRGAWTWNLPDGEAQFYGPFCTDCLIAVARNAEE